MKKKKTIIDEFSENPEEIVVTKNEQENPLAEQENIFTRGLDGMEWKGEALHPFSFQRRRAAAALGLRMGTLSEAEGKEFEATGLYKGIDSDVIIMLWVLTQPASEVLRAIRLPEQGFAKVMSFGEREEIEPGTAEFEEAAKIMISAFVDLAKTKGIYKSPEGNSKGKSSGN